MAFGSLWPVCRKLRWTASRLPRRLARSTTAASILDRLLHHASVVITDGGAH